MVNTGVLVAGLLLHATPPGAESVGRIVSLSGAVVVHRDGQPTPAQRGDYLGEGDSIETGEGKVRLLMRDQSVLSLAAHSHLRLTAYQVEPAVKRRSARLTVLAGRLWALVSEAIHPEARYEVESGNAVAGVRGTELVFAVDAEGAAAVTVIDGAVELTSASVQETLGAMEQGSVARAGAIALASTDAVAIASLRDAVQPKQVLDAASAAKRLRALRKATEEDNEASAAVRLQTESAAGGDESGRGDSTFEDSQVAPETGEGPEPPGTNFFDPSTMARVHVSVEVRR